MKISGLKSVAKSGDNGAESSGRAEFVLSVTPLNSECDAMSFVPPKRGRAIDAAGSPVTFSVLRVSIEFPLMPIGEHELFPEELKHIAHRPSTHVAIVAGKKSFGDVMKSEERFEPPAFSLEAIAKTHDPVLLAEFRHHEIVNLRIKTEISSEEIISNRALRRRSHDRTTLIKVFDVVESIHLAPGELAVTLELEIVEIAFWRLILCSGRPVQMIETGVDKTAFVFGSRN